MRHRKGCLWLGAGLVLALLAGGLTFVTVQRATIAAKPVVQEEVPKIEVVVTTREIPLGTVIQEGDVELSAMPAEVVPEGVVLKVEKAIGKISMRELTTGEMLLAHQLADPSKRGEDIAFTIEEGQVAMAFPAHDLMSTLGILKPGDRVDILFSLEIGGEEEGEGSLVTFTTLQNLEIAAVVLPPARTSEGGQEGRPTPQALLLSLDPQDALILKHLKDAGGIVDVVLRTPADKRRFETQPVDSNYLIDRYQIRFRKLPEE